MACSAPNSLERPSSPSARMRYCSEKHPRLCLETFGILQKRGELCDIVLQVGQRRIYAHKLVLSACSPYFRAMFTSEMAESRQSEVTIRDVDEQALEMLIDFCYSAQIMIEESNVQTLLPAACLLQLQEIQDVCCDFLKKQLDPSNCLGIRAFADTHACRDLLRIADKFTQHNFQEVMESEEFLLLPVNQLIDIISSDELNVRSEEQVFKAVMAWIRHGLPERRQYLSQVLQHVRLPLCNPKFLVGTVGSDILVKADETCRELVDEAKNYLLLPQERPNMQGPRTRPRKPIRYGEVLYAVGGWCSGDAIASVERLDPRTGEWKCVAPMTKRRCGVGVAVLNDLLYAVGGHDGQSYLNSIERYDPQTNQWCGDVAPTSTCRTSVGVAVLDGNLYAVGGQDGVSCLNVVERYDPHTNRWTKVAPMTTRRLGVAVAVLGGCLYAVGGSDGANPLNTVERYDPRLNKWFPVAPMGTRRKHLGCAVYNNCLYAVGGRDDATELSSAERYNPQTNQWSTVVAMNSRRSGVGLAVVNGQLYAVGGFDGSTYLKTVEVYDRDNNQWRHAGSMNYRRLGGGVGVVSFPVMSGRIPPTDSSDEDDFPVAESSNISAVSNRLGSLFATTAKVSGNESLTYQAPKQPKDETPNKGEKVSSATDAEGVPVRVIHATTAHAFILKDGQYVSNGKIGAAVLGNRAKQEYKILLYLSNKQPIGQASITVSFAIEVSANNYVSFMDDRSISWSLAFESENQILMFLKYVLAVKAMLFGDHHKDIVFLNIEEGEGNPIGEGDSSEIDYSEFIIEDGPVLTEFNGNLNSDQKPLRIKLGKSDAPKGWMDGLIGMKKRGKRLFVIPPDLGYSGRDSNASFPTNTPLLVYAIVKRVKFANKQHSGRVERKLSTDSTISSSTVEIASENAPETVAKEIRNEIDVDKTKIETDVQKKADLINRMARIGHAVIGTVPVGPNISDVPQAYGQPMHHVNDTGQFIPTKQNQLPVVCADVTIPKSSPVASNVAITKSSSDGSILSQTLTVPSAVGPSPFGSLQHHLDLNSANQLSLPSMPSVNSTLPYMFPFAYPPQSYFLQPPFIPPTYPPISTSDFSSMSSSMNLSSDRQLILDEIQKSHLQLQDALTKTLVTNLNNILTKLTDIGDQSKLSGIGERQAEEVGDTTRQTNDAVIGHLKGLGVSDDALQAVVSKLDQLETVISDSLPNVVTSEKLTKLVEQMEQNLRKFSAVEPLRDEDSIFRNEQLWNQRNFLTEQISSLQHSVETIKASCSQFASQNEWKEKYDKLKSQAITMKESYEDRVRVLEEQLHEHTVTKGLSESDKVKKIMSSFYKTVSGRFSSGDQFEGEVVRGIILEAVKECTLNAINEKQNETNTDTVPERGHSPSIDDGALVEHSCDSSTEAARLESWSPNEELSENVTDPALQASMQLNENEIMDKD